MTMEKPKLSLRDDLERSADPSRFPGAYDPLASLYMKYRVCMVRLYVETEEGDKKVGAAFHIGNGWLVTARHVLYGHRFQLAEYEFAPYRDTPIGVTEVHFSEEADDLALLQTDFSLDWYLTSVQTEGTADQRKEGHIELGGQRQRRWRVRAHDPGSPSATGCRRRS